MKKSFWILFFAVSFALGAADKNSPASPRFQYAFGPDECGDMMVWDVPMGMCMPLPMDSMPMSMVMVHGNGFLVGITEQGPRGRTAIASPNMVMADIGTTVAGIHYFNLDLMLTAERWTIPHTGYPELLQVGEENAQGQPFLDAQHPHSSPIMGLTLSDTIRLGGEKNYLKLSFAPRGESTDGPVAFMHRPTGMANPDAPLGHHVGQDVGHVTSTVFAASAKLGTHRIEASSFNGTEPQPTQVDLPTGAPNSVAVRWIEEVTSKIFATASYAYVQFPEPDQPDISFVARYCASLQTELPLTSDWTWFNTFIVGLIANYDHAPTLISFGEEFWFRNPTQRWWGRWEVLQRTPGQLEIGNLPDETLGRWVGALTLGYSHQLISKDYGEINIGASVTGDWLPSEFSGAYGGSLLFSAKIFAQVTGMQMWDL